MDWRNELSSIVNGRARMTRAEQENADYENFLLSVAKPALEEVAEELRSLGREVSVRVAPASVRLQVRSGEYDEIVFSVMKKYVQNGILPSAEIRVLRGTGPLNKYEALIREGTANYRIEEVTRDDVIACFIKYYRMAVNDGPRV
jgi:uncharacterized protein (UPF0297 family)